ncbi:MAG TPA: hypothetical protein VGH49_12590 [Xanthobacteraceae bacterium]|jgi:hypothetical protein
MSVGLLRLGLRGVVSIAVFSASAFIPAVAEDSWSIAGTYVQNADCKGDGTDPAAKIVRITDTDVHSNFGLCTFLKQERDGKTLSAQMSCNGPGGNILLGDVRFTVRDERTVEFVDQDNTYHSVLHRCPQSDGARQAPSTTSGTR